MDTRPFCPDCKTRFRCKKNEVAIRYGNEDQPERQDGSVLVGDLWECPSCGFEIVIGWAYQPWDPNLCPNDRERILQVVQAIDASVNGYVALDEVRREPMTNERIGA
jgi:hypothetical protein